MYMYVCELFVCVCLRLCWVSNGLVQRAAILNAHENPQNWKTCLATVLSQETVAQHIWITSSSYVCTILSIWHKLKQCVSECVCVCVYCLTLTFPMSVASVAICKNRLKIQSECQKQKKQKKKQNHAAMATLQILWFVSGTFLWKKFKHMAKARIIKFVQTTHICICMCIYTCTFIVSSYYS